MAARVSSGSQLLSWFFGEHLEPDDPALAAVGPADRLVEDVLRRAPDVRPGAVALDEGDHRLRGHLEPAAPHGNGVALDGNCHERVPCNGSE